MMQPLPTRRTPRSLSDRSRPATSTGLVLLLLTLLTTACDGEGFGPIHALEGDERNPIVVELSRSSLTLGAPGDTARVDVTVHNGKDDPVEEADPQWGSSDPAIVSVEDGLVEATGSGSAVVAAAYAGAVDSLQVKVGGAPPGGEGDGGGTDEDETGGGEGTGGGSSATAECADPDPAWIWCDDFEENRLGEYFEYSDAGGSFVRADGVGMNGTHGMRVRFNAGQVGAGSLKLAFGRTPGSYFRPVDEGTRDYRDIYWRVYVRYADDWVGGGGDKMSRATVFARSDWSQAMIGHVWSGRGSSEDHLVIDPASGTTSGGSLITNGYNDFNNLRWLGAERGDTPIFAQTGEWHCVEARVRLNGSANDGLFEMWVNGRLDARISNMNWLGSYSDYGINAVFLENYWNAGSPRTQERYFDRFVVSTEPIGC